MKFFSWLLTVVIILACACFAVSNRQDVTVDLWPVGYLLTSPLYVVTLGTFFLGFLLGAFAFWLGGLRHRWDKRQLSRQVTKLKTQLDEEVSKRTVVTPPPPPPPPPYLPPIA